MAWTWAYGGLVKTYWKVYFYYNWEPTYSDTQSRLTWYYGIRWDKSIAGNDSDNNYMCKYDSASYLSCTGQSKKTTYPSSTTLTKTWYAGDADKCYAYGSGTYYFNRETANKTITVIASINHNSNGTKYKGTSTKSVSFTVPVRNTYSVSFDGNPTSEVSNLSDSLSALYNNSVILPAGPTRSNWGFKQWNSNSSGTGVVYNSGDSYTITSNTTLYAIWEYNLPLMVDFQLKRVELLSANNFKSNDEGTIVAVTFTYSSGYVPTSGTPSYATTTVSASINGTTLGVYNGNNFNDTSFTFSGTGTMTKYFNVASYSSATSHQITFSLSENSGVHTTTFITILSSSLYPIELSSNGELLSFGSDTRCKKKLYLLVDNTSSSGEGYNLWQVLNQLEWTDVMTDE